MNENKLTVEQVDAVLPQTQCEECGYKGCKPYAEAIVKENEAIHLCPPGGVDTLKKLAHLTQQTYAPWLNAVEQNTRPPMVAMIREDECIGCTKCIQACPVDAIVGSGKLMHTVISSECTGCQLCISPCPVDCIDMLSLEQIQFNAETARQRFENRKLRLASNQSNNKKQHNADRSPEMTAKQAYILEAMSRVKTKRKQA